MSRIMAVTASQRLMSQKFKGKFIAKFLQLDESLLSLFR